jgi:protein-tyrosine-phosphatase
VIFAMTRTHQAALAAQWPSASSRTKLVCPDGDVSDPIGGPPVVYEQCAVQLEAALEKCVGELPL